MKAPYLAVMLLAPLVCARANMDSTTARLLQAKTSCIHLLNGSEKDVAAARKELKTWGRFKLVDSCSAADVAVWISAKSPEPNNNVCGVRVQVLGASDNALLWAGSRKCTVNTAPVVGQLVRKLRADMAHMKK